MLIQDILSCYFLNARPYMLSIMIYTHAPHFSVNFCPDIAGAASVDLELDLPHTAQAESWLVLICVHTAERSYHLLCMHMYGSMFAPGQLWSYRLYRSWSMQHRDSWPTWKEVYSVPTVSILLLHILGES
jgi:hypothetical protein